MKILMVLTSHDQLGHTGRKTGFWLEEFAAPYYVFKDAGATITLASPRGGKPPIDPRSEEPAAQTTATLRFRYDKPAKLLSGTERLAGIAPDAYDAVFYPGGHGPLWDLAEDAVSVALIEAMQAGGKIIAGVCHGPGVFRHVKTPTGAPLVRGKFVTGFANTEEEEVRLTHVVPFLVEDSLEQNGGIYSKSENWTPHVVSDGRLITGQNPASSQAAAETVLERLRAARIGTAPRRAG